MYIDLPGSKVNTIGKSFYEQIPPLVDKLEADESVKVIVFISAKEGDFIAGADVNMITELAAKGKDAVKQEGVVLLQNFFKKMEQGKPKIAAINGSCLGGGLEFALACHYRIATDQSGTSLGLPEVMLGLLPGGGGTQRLPKLIGVQNALPMLLTGAAKKAKQAKSLGLVDLTCPKDQLEAAALKCAQDLAEGTLKIKRGPPKGLSGYIEAAIKDYEFVRNYVFSQAKAQVLKQSGGHYPAPLKIVDLVKKSIETKALATAKGYELEADAFADLALTPVSDGLKAVFFGQTALKKNPFSNPLPISNIGVLGAGLMGAGIAEVSVAKGYRVALKDVNLAGLQRGEQQIEANFRKKVSKKSLSEFDKNVLLSNLVGLTDDMPFWTRHFAKSDLVIEAVFEEIGVKHRVIESMEKIVPPHCIIATNTSSLAVGEIAKASKRPENVVGMHYFSPVDKMQLIEVIPHKGTSEAVVATAVQVGLRQGKIPVVCKDVPGFYVNRCLAPYIDESMVLAFELERLLDLDKAMKAMGFPVGPIALADEVGVDVAFHVHANLRADIPARMSGANVAAMAAIKAAGIKGKRFGSGFCTYPSDKKGKGPLAWVAGAVFKSKVQPNPVAMEAMKPFMKPVKVSTEEIQTRMAARFINEAVFCLQDGVIRNQVDGDMAAIFGIGQQPPPHPSAPAPAPLPLWLLGECATSELAGPLGGGGEGSERSTRLSSRAERLADAWRREPAWRPTRRPLVCARRRRCPPPRLRPPCPAALARLVRRRVAPPGRQASRPSRAGRSGTLTGSGCPSTWTRSTSSPTSTASASSRPRCSSTTPRPAASFTPDRPAPPRRLWPSAPTQRRAAATEEWVFDKEQHGTREEEGRGRQRLPVRRARRSSKL